MVVVVVVVVFGLYVVVVLLLLVRTCKSHEHVLSKNSKFEIAKNLFDEVSLEACISISLRSFLKLTGFLYKLIKNG